jgi:SP family galactose:H+ symporter-like MFS transporter
MTEPASKQKSPDGSLHPIVYVFGITAAIAGMLYGLGFGVSSGAQGFVQKTFGISNGNIGILVGMLNWGAVCGTVLSGFVSREIGRRRTIMISALIFFIGCIGCSLGSSAIHLGIFRFTIGISLGMACFTTPLYLSEISPQKVRGVIIGFYELMLASGILLAFLGNAWLGSYLDLNQVVGGHWRLMYLLISLPAAVLFVGVLFVPESPRWLFLKGRGDQALLEFRRMHLSEAAIQKEVASIQTTITGTQSARSLLGNGNFCRAVGLGIGLQMIQQLAGITIIITYAPRIFRMAGFTEVSQQLWGTVLCGTTHLLAVLLAILFLDKLGRKPIMFTGFVVMGVAMISLGTLFKIGVSGHPSLGIAAVISVLVFCFGFAISAGSVIWVLCSEIFPLSGRELGITFSTATNFVVSACIVQLFLPFSSWIGIGNAFLLIGAMNVLYILFFLKFVPETKGISLETIETNLMSGKPLRELGS